MQFQMNLRCPQCGQAIPPKFSITGRYRPHVVGMIAQRSSEGGVTLQEVADVVYSDATFREEPRKSIWLLVRLANRELRPQGYQIVPLFRGPGARWVLREIDGNSKRQQARHLHHRAVEGVESAGTAGLY